MRRADARNVSFFILTAMINLFINPTSSLYSILFGSFFYAILLYRGIRFNEPPIYNHQVSEGKSL